MKVLHIENSSGRGGSLKSLQSLWPAPSRCQVEVVALQRKWSDNVDCPYPVTSIEKHSTYRAWRFLQQGQFDVLHINNALIEAWSFVLAAWWEGVPVVSHFRSLRPFRKIEHLLARMSEKIFVLSQSHKNLLPHFVSVDVLYNAIPDKGLSTERKKGCIGIFSVLKEGKGHGDIIRALSDIKDHWQLEIAGGSVSDQPSTLQALKKLVADLKLDNRVTFHGHLSDPSELMKQCAVVVDPSHKAEGFRRTIGEAAMMGCAVLATRVGGVEDLLLEEELVNAGDVLAWREVLKKFLNSEIKEERSRELRLKAQSMFDSKTCYDRFWKLVCEYGERKK